MDSQGVAARLPHLGGTRRQIMLNGAPPDLGEAPTCLADLCDDWALHDLHNDGRGALEHAVGAEHVGARGWIGGVAGGRPLGIAGVVPYHLAPTCQH